MNFDFALMGEKELDWDQFLVDAVLAPESSPASPTTSDSQTATPRSTESEQSAALDVPEEEEFDFFNLASGIMHDSTDLFGLPAYTAAPDAHGTSDPTMTSTFGLDFGDFGDMTGLGQNAAVQLGLADLVNQLNAVPAAPAPAGVDFNVALKESYAALGWVAPAPVAVEPAQLISPRPTLKRKDSQSSADSAPQVKRPRGRPPKSRSDSGSVPPVPAPAAPKRPYRRQSKTSALSGSISGTPVLRTGVLADDEDSDCEDSLPKLTPSGKASTARPKSVVPEKYFKDGSAQLITGMTVDQITAYPTFEELLKHVKPELRAGAAEFGARISENRDKAKDAAKKSRDERRQKIDSLEATVAGLEGKIVGMQGVLMALVSKGVLSAQEVSVWL